jgi:hypothetical protein
MAAPPEPKRRRVRNQAEMQEAAVQAMLAAGIPMARAVDVLRARLDPGAPSTLAALLQQRFDLPSPLIAQIVREYESRLEPVEISVGAFYTSRQFVEPGSFYPAFARRFKVSRFATVREIVEQAQTEAELEWAKFPEVFRDWRLDRNLRVKTTSKLITVALDPVATVDIRRKFRVGQPEDIDVYFPRDRYLYNGRTQDYIVSPNARLLTYAGSGQPSEFEPPKLVTEL